MKKFAWLVVWLTGISCSNAEETNLLPVRVVGLFSTGVGYFQHAGTVSGEGRLTLTFQDRQMNDLLKSLVVEDLSGAAPDPVLYPSEDPQERLLERFHVKLGGNPSLPDIFRQLRGTRIQLQHQGELISGTLLGVEQRPLPVAEHILTDWVLNITTDQGIRVVPFKDMGHLLLMDAAVRDDLRKALSMLDKDRGQGYKSLEMVFPGEGVRQIRVGYVVETPVWKSSFRLVFPEEGDKARLQGWAITENQSSQDWNDVRLFLVSGQPLSFTQNLYQPRYISRPTVDAEAHTIVAAPRYEAGLSAQKTESVRIPRRVRAMSMMSEESVQADESVGASLQEPWENQLVRPAGLSVEAENVGALFQFIVDNVTLPQQRAAMIPIIDDSVTVEKLSIYNSKVLKNHPLVGILLKNSTGKHLPAGPVTLFQGGFYAGDARMEDIPAGQQRLLSYAVDQEIQVLDSTNNRETRITSGKIVAGVLVLQRKWVVQQEYRLENRSSAAKTIIIEHPVRPGWSLVDNSALMETTSAWFRFRRGVPANKQTTLIISEEQIHEERVVLRDMSADRLFAQVQGNHFSAAMREILIQAANYRQAVEKSQRDLHENTQQLENLKKEQERIQANLKAVGSGSAFYNRMIVKLDTQESAIEQAILKVEKLRREYRAALEQWEAFLKNLTVE